jgi:hypothetical protein
MAAAKMARAIPAHQTGARAGERTLPRCKN